VPEHESQACAFRFWHLCQAAALCSNVVLHGEPSLLRVLRFQQYAQRGPGRFRDMHEQDTPILPFIYSHNLPLSFQSA